MPETSAFTLLETMEAWPPMAFQFVDGFTGQAVVKVELEIDGTGGRKVRQVVSPSGVYLLYRLEPGTYVFRASADGFVSWQETRAVVPGQGLAKIVLWPSACYSFPAGTTLIRGTVYAGPQDHPVPRSATPLALPIATTVLTTVSSAKGEISFFLPAVANGNRIESKNGWCVQSPAASNVLKFDCTAARAGGYALVVSPMEAQLSSTEFVWRIGSEVHIDLFI